jgi:hypothetical protein
VTANPNPFIAAPWFALGVRPALDESRRVAEIKLSYLADKLGVVRLVGHVRRLTHNA